MGRESLLQRDSIHRGMARAVLGLAIASLGMTAIGQTEGPRAIGRIRTPALREVSGLAASRQNGGVLWMHNDGESREVFAVTTSGNLVARVRIPVMIDDMEDIAIGPGADMSRDDRADFLYLGDIGDNDESRPEVRVVRFAEPDLSGDVVRDFVAQGVETFRLKYPDGPRDAEALMIDPVSGDLFVVAKEARRSPVYRAAADKLKQNGVATLELVARLKLGLVSGGDISRDGGLIILRSEDRGWLWSRQSSESAMEALMRAPRRVLTRGLRQGENGESVGFSPDGAIYYTASEGRHEAIYAFPARPAGNR